MLYEQDLRRHRRQGVQVRGGRAVGGESQCSVQGRVRDESPLYPGVAGVAVALVGR